MPVYQSNTGRWYFKLQIKGKRYNRAVPEACTKRDAEKAEAVFKADLLQNRINPEANKGIMQFSELVTIYREYAQTAKLSYKKELTRINDLLYFFGKYKLRDITPILIESYRSKRKNHIKQNGKLLTNSSINREISILSKMLSIAVENDWVESNPCRKVKKLRENTANEKILTIEEENRLLSFCTGKFKYLKAIIVIALNTGMRKGEIEKLRWSFVNLDDGYIKVTKTKSGKDRYIPINSKVKIYLEELYKTKNSEYVFLNPRTGLPYNGFRGFDIIREKAGLSELKFHSLRHAAATRMVSAGIDLIVVKDILGHSTVITTMRYSHPSPLRKVEAVEKLAVFNSNVSV